MTLVLKHRLALDYAGGITIEGIPQRSDKFDGFCAGWDAAEKYLEEKMAKMREAVANYPGLVNKALNERDELQFVLDKTGEAMVRILEEHDLLKKQMAEMRKTLDERQGLGLTLVEKAERGEI